MRAVAYLRVSTEEQAASGLGLEAQRHACQGWASREGLAVVGPFEDDISGAAPLDRRAGLLDALAALESGDVLIVAKRDRLGRDPIVVAMIESAVARKGGRVISAAGEGTDDDGPSSVLMRRMVDAFAEYERLIIAARTRAALAAKKRRGERMGKVPIGWRLDPASGDLTADPTELAIVAEVKAMHAAGMSLRQIARALDARGIPPRSGGSVWAHSTISVLLKRPA